MPGIAATGDPSVSAPVGGRRIGPAALIGLSIAAAAVAVFGFGWLAGSAVEPDSRHAVDEVARARPDGTFVVTIDARSLEHWVPFDLRTGRLSPDPEAADVRVRRHSFQVPGGAVDLGPLALREATLPRDPDWVLDRRLEGVVQNEALEDWYDYSYLTHLLTSRRHVYGIRLRDGRLAYLTVESYNCQPEGGGCVTIRYRLG